MNSNLLDQVYFGLRGQDLLGLEDHGFSLFSGIGEGDYYNKYSLLCVN